AVSEPLTEAAARLGEKTPVFSRSRLARLRYEKQGVEVLATDRILATHLVGAKSPAIPIRDWVIGSAAQELKLGMPEKDFTRIVGDAEPYDMRPLDNPKSLYRFYPVLGRAGRFEKDKV